MEAEEYKTLKIVQRKPESAVFDLILNRPSHLSPLFFLEFPKALSFLDHNPAANVLLLSSAANHFCSGIDLSSLSSAADQAHSAADQARSAEFLRRHIKGLQDAITALERCRKPVIAAIHGACIGGGVDLATACDVRFCTTDAFFSVKEVDLAITADLGTLQRLPAIVGYGNAAELALTGRRFSGAEAKRMGLVSGVFGSRGELEEGVRGVAEEMASKSALAVRGTKAVLLRSRELSVEQGLDYVATWNSSMLLSDDLTEAVTAHLQKRKPAFAKL